MFSERERQTYRRTEEHNYNKGDEERQINHMER
jgi:hypothetical protein